MGEAAVSLATLGKYKGAGTVEFLLQDGKFYLLEVNTRLQVEHSVTEMVLGVDLVKMQILTAQGDFIFKTQDYSPRGHAIEGRVYAENPYLGGIPSTGLLGHVSFPEGPGRRFEYGFESGDQITSFYDPMIAKVIVWDESRPRAIQKMIKVLEGSVIFGVHTNIPYLIAILKHPEFINGTMTTRFIENNFAEGLKAAPLAEKEKILFEKVLSAHKSSFPSQDAQGGIKVNSPWNQSWRIL